MPRISQLPDANLPLSGSELVPVVQGGATKHAPASALGVTQIRAHGYIGDGSSHPASGRFNSLAAAQAVYPSCLSLADEIDGLALQTALTDLSATTAAAELLLPAGQGRISRSLTATLTGNTALSIRGAGSDVSELLFVGDTDGIVVTYASSASFTRDTTTGAALKVVGISVIRNPGSTSKDGIRIIGDSANASGTIQPDTVFNDVVVRGGANGGGWTNCIVAQDVADTSWFHVICNGPFSASAITSPARGTGTAGVVIKTTGSRYATQHNFAHSTFNNIGRGLDIYEHIQGVAVTNCNFTGGQYGIYWNSVGREEQLAVSNSQFSVLVSCIYCFNMQNVAAQGNVFYNQNSYVPTGSVNNWTGIQLAECDNCTITGNNFMGALVGIELAISITNDTALVPAGRPSAISGNTFYNIHGQALYTANNTTDVFFVGNTVDGTVGFPVIAVGDGTTPVCMSNSFGNAPFLLGFPGATVVKSYALEAGINPFTIVGSLEVRGPVQFAPFTAAALPSPEGLNNGYTIRLTDRNQRLATSDGTDWRFTDGTIVT